MTGFT